MKNRIKKKSKPETVKITLELLPEEFDGLKQMADYLEASVKQVVEALVWAQPEDYLERKNDDIWSSLVDYIADCYGDTPRLKLVRRHLLACEANSDLPSIAERRPLFDRVLQNADNYAAYLAKMEKRGLSIAQDKAVAA